MALVLEMVLDAEHAVPFDWAIRLAARAVLVDRYTVVFHLRSSNRTRGLSSGLQAVRFQPHVR